MGFWDAALLVLAACGAGALNAIAGGGSFLSFPALVLTGVPALSANATSTVALWPGSLASTLAYRDELRASREHLIWLSAVSLGGGICGALLLLLTPSKTFEAMVPFLLLIATLMFTFGEALRRRVPALGARQVVMPLWVLISVYGGYFGGGMSLMMLAALTLAAVGDLHRMNALKSGLGVLVNGVAVAVFAVAGAVQWAQAGLMVVGSVLGGYLGARLARKVDPKRVRPLVVALGWGLTAAFFWRTFGRV
ncbi:MAG: sulfite exporter TauE/SafE family protein [Archangiaceae bacterium]|nr:sulfite exporter TauE/SafE family protein [Archangiaceae bacterium]